LVLAARRKEELEKVATKCTELGAKGVCTVVTDISKEEDCK
jgi:hypothetical protein